ncbi:MAG: type II secretion system F family protein [Rhodospirillaceae bacterium]|nr:type II secretion system F family protein [Rhodospirillaceae bacterium]
MTALEKLLPPGVTIDDVITAMAAIAAFLSALAVWYGLIAPQASTRRVRELAARRDALRAGLLTPKRRTSERPKSASLMRRVVQQLNLERSHRAEAIQTLLAQAGWRSRDAVTRYLFFRLTLPLLFGLTSVVLVDVMHVYPLSSMLRLLIDIGAVLLGWIGPDLFIKNAVEKRAKKLRLALPDAIDLMVICAEAGLSLDAMLKRVSDEFHRSSPELADELALTSLELGFLPDRRQALVNLSIRSPLPGLRAVVNSLIQADRFGTPLAQSLRVLASEFREERMLKAEEKAARLPALLTVPMIVFILPPLFVVLLGPAILRTMDALSHLHH